MKRSLHYRLILMLPLFFVFLLPCEVFAQPTVLGTQLVNGSYSTTNLTLRGGARFVRLQATSSAAISTRNWEFAAGNASSTIYEFNWRPYTSGQTLSGYNAYIDPSTANASARYNSGFGGQSGLLPAITNGNYYTFNVGTNGGGNNFMSVMETSYNPTAITAVTQSPLNSSVFTSDNVTVTVTTAAPLNAGEFAYVRYSTNSFSSSTLIPVTMSGATGTAVIPSGVNTANTTVLYYVFTSNQSSIASAQSDYFTLNLFNTTGQNTNGATFSYTVQTRPIAPKFVVHQQSTATVVNACTGSSTYWGANPTIAANLVLQWNIEDGFDYTGSAIYYTTDGSVPSGSRGVAQGTAAAINSTFVCNVDNKNVVTGTIPASANLEGRTIRYVIGAWKGPGGIEGFATTNFSTERNTIPFIYSYALPSITTTGTLTAFSKCAGLVSAEQNFSLTSVNLSSNLVVTAPTGFEISKTSGSGFSQSISLSTAEAASVTVYVRMTAAATGNPSGNITLVTTGLSKNIAVTGTVTAAPNAGTVSGTQAICSNGTTQFATTGSGGTWSSDATGVATVDATTGLVSGASAGNTTIRYTVIGTGGCTNAVATRMVTVTTPPNAGTVSGTQAICSNGTTQFATTGSGGTWSSDATGVATVDATTGLVSGASAGTATITYTVVGTGGCTNAVATRMVTVTTQPNAGTVSGTQAICSNGTTQFATTGSGGTWSSDATGVASVNATTGLVSGASGGIANITYTVLGTGGCTNATATRMVTVTSATAWYLDADNDTYGDATVMQLSCSQPSGYVSNNTDCNDGVFAINPGVTEICWNNIDDNCDNTKSEGCIAIPVNVNNPGVITNFATHLSASVYFYLGSTTRHYRYEVKNVATGATVEFDKTDVFSRYFTIPLALRAFNTQYEIRTAAIIDGEVLPYAGSTLMVSSGPVPAVKLIASSCGTTLSSINGTIVSTPGFNTAFSYEFRMRPASTMNPYVFASSSNIYLSFGAFMGVQNGNTYEVSVRYAYLNNSMTAFSDWGAPCLVTTPGAPPAVLRTQAAAFKVVAYPNPFSEGFQLNVTTQNTGIVSVQAFDMLGRLIEERSSKVGALENLTIGANYPSGVYNVIVSQDDEIRTVRVVKR